VSRPLLYTLRDIGGEYFIESIRPFTKY
jgi:hypothetical protein